MNELDRLLDEYRNHFKDNFPMMLCRTMEEENIVDIIKKCLEDDEPYSPELDAKANY